MTVDMPIQVYRFYYRCTNCAAEFTMKTDPKNSDYTLEQVSPGPQILERLRRRGDQALCVPIYMPMLKIMTCERR